ncbi:ABC transporter ATP-binding protein [Deinococcus cellulosilyticus]|uniref:Macrolide ABC transporter ATP-binding protein n=1 Tax=Deinococcus cellulosilyticus (strain DSM 18568 / NBRC 106333 / KACC 11606 / 5516J-15) TaxID=1223518 RepID=A0A511N0G8_DEIC1|nr:ABC transporter ATP-binding protein [Deinococcus cellulosilyticus]GEM46344.1 macrolide ABC transporter ATP-binding protein [Deinococcus cellulosilyticus NBRC 106333 = KACC 11606]
MTPLIELRDLTRSYVLGGERFDALRNVNLSIQQGEFVAIQGPSGSGKSSLMHLIGLLDRPTSGEYLLQGRPTAALDSRIQARIRNQTIGFVFQAFHLLPRLTVLENVCLPLEYAGVKKTVQLEEATQVLDTLGLLSKKNVFPTQLSGGQKQRVAIARALINKPPLLLADEPTGNLDSKTSHSIMTLLSELHARGHTVVLITHEEDIARYAHRFVRVMDGQVQEVQA